MKLIILFIIIGFVKVFWADAGRAQLEAGKMLNDTRRAWDSELNKTETNAVRVFNGLISQMTAFKKTVIDAVTSSGDLIYLRNINETLSKQIERVRNRLSEKNVGEVFNTADGFVQELLNSINKEISNAPESSSKLDSCWDQQKAKIQLTIDNLVKDVRNLVATEMKPLNDLVEKTRGTIDQANSEVVAGYKLCQSDVNFKLCAITFVSLVETCFQNSLSIC